MLDKLFKEQEGSYERFKNNELLIDVRKIP